VNNKSAVAKAMADLRDEGVNDFQGSHTGLPSQEGDHAGSPLQMLKNHYQFIFDKVINY
jgi:hypothetical protein